jgi:hypothetical protein
MHLSYTDTSTVSKWTETRFNMTNVNMEIHRVHRTTIFERMVCSTQTMHLSCTKISAISKWTETSIHLSLNTLEYHRVRPKRFLSLWYILRNHAATLRQISTISKQTKMSIHLSLVP